MHDIRVIRDDPAAFDAALARRGLAPMSPEILALDADRRARIAAAETAQADQNKASKEVGAAKARGDDAEFDRLRALVGEKKSEIAAMQAETGRAVEARAALEASRPVAKEATRWGRREPEPPPPRQRHASPARPEPAPALPRRRCREACRCPPRRWHRRSRPHCA